MSSFRRTRAILLVTICTVATSVSSAAPTVARVSPVVIDAGSTSARVAQAVDDAPSGGWFTLGEYRVSPRPTNEFTRSREPTAAAHPFDASRLAVVYPKGGESSSAVLRISRDGGATWTTTAGRPRGGGSHPIVAWGPGPQAGAARLYYAGMGGTPGNYHWVVSYSDNEGATWRQGFVANRTRGWFGGYADLVVDRTPSSPNYGVVYLAYNWPKDLQRGPGLRVVASGDYGRTFSEVEIPKLAAPSGYPDAWRIGYRLATAPDGSAYVSSYQLDMKVWRSAAPFSKGGSANIGRLAFGVARLFYDPVARTLTHGPNVLVTTLPRSAWNVGWTAALQGANVGLAESCWATRLSVDASGRIYYALAGDGRIQLLTSDDEGETWRAQFLPAAPMANGRPQKSIRPDLVIGDGFAAVLFHTVDASGSARTVGNAVAVSFDRGETWDGPRPVNGRRWAVAPILARYNGPGLRDSGVLLADNRTLFFAYGDGRDGYSAVFGARLRVVPPLSPTP